MPSRRIRKPFFRSSFQIGVFHSAGPPFSTFGAPDVVDEHIDTAVLVTDTIGQRRDLRRFEMVDGDRDALAAESGHKLGCLLDRLAPVIVGSRWSIGARAAAAGADHRRAGLAERGGDAAAGAARRACHDGDTSAKRALV